MIKKVTIDNFMAHEHTELELGPGVTILTGSNNTGKSAVVEALRCVATNPTPSHFIRHGAKEARVGVEMDDGTRVVWVRTKRWAMYKLWHPGAEEPEEYHKLQRKVPEDIQNVLRMNQVDLETSKKAIDIHIGNQREPVFLLNRPDSDTAAFFAASTESAHLLAMQDLLKMQTRDKKREAKGLEADVVRIEGDIDALAPLPEIELQVEQARELEHEILSLEREIPVLEALLVRNAELSATLGTRQAAAKTLKKTDSPPELYDLQGLNGVLNGMGAMKSSLAKAERISTALAPLPTPPVAEDTASLGKMVQSLDATERMLRKVADQSVVLNCLVDAPEREKARELSDFMDEYLALSYRQLRLGRWNDILQNVAEPPALEPEGELRALLVKMRDLEERKQTQENALTGLEKDLQIVVDRLTERVEALGQCPTCGQAMTTDNILDHGGCHDA